jgi:predicted tellurium resistance membrane protein TerC
MSSKLFSIKTNAERTLFIGHAGMFILYIFMIVITIMIFTSEKFRHTTDKDILIIVTLILFFSSMYLIYKGKKDMEKEGGDENGNGELPESKEA